MLKKFISACILTLFLTSATLETHAASTSQQIVVDLKEGSLHLEDLLSSSNEIAKSTPSKFVNKKVVGKILEINGKKYEVRYFAFEDAENKLPRNITFQEYAANRNLLKIKSTSMKPLPNIHFESFDCRKAKVGDGVYFSMALRQLIE